MKKNIFALLKKLYHHRSAVFFALFGVCAGLYAIKTGFILSSGKIDDEKTIFSLFFCLASLIVVITTRIVYFHNKAMPLHKQFAVLFLTFGTLFLIVIPTWTAPDTYAHWYRILEVSRGHIVSAVNPDTGHGGQLLPKGAVPNFNGQSKNDNYVQFASTYNDRLDNTKLEWITFSSSALYSPVTYLFQLPGVWLSGLLTDRPFVISFAGRVSAFILSFLLLFFAIKRLPAKKMSFLFLSLTPMFLQEATSLAGDALINAAGFAIAAFALYYASDYIKKISVKEIAVICFLTFVTSLGKIVYLPLLALFFLIPAAKFSSKRSKLAFLIILSSIAVLLNFAWLLAAKQFLIEFHEGVNSAEQVLYVISHPLHFVITLIKTYIVNMNGFIKMFLGMDLGWLNIPVNSIAIKAYLLLLLAASVIDNNGAQTAVKKQLLFFGLPSLAVMVLIGASLYVQWTAVGQPFINGIQGRYFIPIAFCLIGVVPNIVSNFTLSYKNHVLNFLIDLSGIKIKFNQKQIVLSVNAFFKIGLIIIAAAAICSISAVMKAFV